MITACRKNKDTSSPQVDILSPVSTSSYTYNDDLPVRIVFSDDQTLDQLQIELVSTNNNSVFFATTLYPNVATYIFDEIIPLRDRYWPEGKMFVRATASDGINTSTQIQEFYYGEAPLSIDNEWRVIQDGQGYMILDLDNQLIHSETKEYVGGGYEPRTGKYWIAHSDGSLINRSTSSDYTLSTFTLATIPVTTYHEKEREEYFIGCANGSIWKWQNGNVQSFVLGDNKNVRQITANKSHLFVWKEEPVTGQDYINIYNIETGAAMNSVIATYNLTSIGKYTDQEIIIAGNIKGTSHFGFLVPDSESIIQNYSFTESSTCQNLWPALNGGIFGDHENGLFYYAPGLTSMQEITGLIPRKITIDHANQLYVIITSEGIYRIDTHFNISTNLSQKNIVDYFILYNK